MRKVTRSRCNCEGNESETDRCEVGNSERTWPRTRIHVFSVVLRLLSLCKGEAESHREVAVVLGGIAH